MRQTRFQQLTRHITLLVVGVCVGVLPAAPAQASATGVVPEQTSVWLNWAGSGMGFEQRIEILDAPEQHFWASQWPWAERPAEGGYLGLQSSGAALDGTETHQIIFSVWGAVGAQPTERSRCGRFAPEGEGGEGYSCRIALNGDVRGRWLLSLRRRVEPGATVWRATVKHETTQQVYQLGSIRTDGVLSINGVNNFIEDFGVHRYSCMRTPTSAAVFAAPLLRGASAPGEVRIHLGDCGRASATSRVLQGRREVLLSQ